MVRGAPPAQALAIGSAKSRRSSVLATDCDAIEQRGENPEADGQFVHRIEEWALRDRKWNIVVERGWVFCDTKARKSFDTRLRTVLFSLI